MGILADDRTEEKLIRALKFVKVAVKDTGAAGVGPVKSGYLTDVSVAMLMVEMQRAGLVVSNGDR
jgi:hypothetical protein